MAKRLAGRFGYPEDEPFRPGVLHPFTLNDPAKWKKPCRVFVCSMGDLLHRCVSLADIDSVLHAIDRCEEHTFMLLTKRPENFATKLYEVTESVPCRELGGGDYLPNLWLGATIENQKRANERIPILLETPAALRFVSVEPMLGPVEIWRWLHCPRSKPCHGPRPGCDDLCDVCWGSDGLRWIICGPETGPGKRPFDPEWAHDLYRQCQAAGVAYFYKGKDWQELGLPREFPE